MKSKPGQPKSKPSAKPQQEEQPPSLQEKLDQTRLDQQYWAQVAAGPNLSPAAAAWGGGPEGRESGRRPAAGRARRGW